MKKLIVLSFVLLTIIGCRNKESTTKNSNAEMQEVSEVSISPINLGCYVFDDNKSTISLEITENVHENEVKGNLTYALAEKDKNSGSFVGQLKNGILIADYTFQSEGIQSIRQIAFKVNGDTLIEGYGELNPEGTAFKDIDSIQFVSTMPLVKSECPKQRVACLYEEGKVYSEIEQSCLTLATLKTKLNPLENGARIDGIAAYLIFSSDNTKAEIFLPKSNTGIVLEKSGEGNWVSKNFTLSAWKGYVLLENGVAIYAGQ